MTREDVRAQLAKNTLEWEEDVDGNLIAEVCQLEREVCITYRLIEDDVYVKATYRGVRYVGEFLGVEGGEETLKTIAEDHRLELACRLLGIED